MLYHSSEHCRHSNTDHPDPADFSGYNTHGGACRREAFLPVRSAGGWASKMVWALPSPVVVGDEIWIFYAGA